jgi:3-dehydroquinate synthase
MSKLFMARMKLAEKVAHYKKENHLPILDSKREEQLLAENLEIIDHELKPYYSDFLKSLMSISRKYQRNLINETLDYVYIQRGILTKADKFFDLDRKTLVVTDTGVPKEYAEKICQLAKSPVLVTIEQGESSKSIENFQLLFHIMLENGFDRNDCIVAVGGGVVGDLAGFVAACYMRGIDFYNVPTTLLSQVDSSIGGKTAINFEGIKNIIGAFYQPKAVLIDTELLKTLGDRQFNCGIAEIIKMAITLDLDLFNFLETNNIKENLEEIIARALTIKAKIVAEDEKESDLRRVLNFGHTLGHGIESVTDLLHGECVALGMIPMVSKELRPRLKNLLEKNNLPTKCKADSSDVVNAAMHDKKSKGNYIVTVGVSEIGEFEFVKSSKEDLLRAYEEALL